MQMAVERAPDVTSTSTLTNKIKSGRAEPSVAAYTLYHNKQPRMATREHVHLRSAISRHPTGQDRRATNHILFFDLVTSLTRQG